MKKPKCKNCGASLTVSTESSLVCEYCTPGFGGIPTATGNLVARRSVVGNLIIGFLVLCVAALPLIFMGWAFGLLLDFVKNPSVIDAQQVIVPLIFIATLYPVLKFLSYLVRD